MIRVKSKLQKLDRFVSASSAYLKLRKVLSEDELFLLESLSGPTADKNKVLVGFNPMLNLIVKNQSLEITGNELLKKLITDKVKSKTKLKSSKSFVFKLSNIAELLDLLRLIESLFKVEYLGSHRGFQFGFFGYIDGAVTESLNGSFKQNQKVDIPDLYLSIYQGLVYSDLVSQSTSLIINQIEGAACYSRASIEALLFEEEVTYQSVSNRKLPKAEFKPLFNTNDDLVEEIEKLKLEISEGKLYKATISQCTTMKTNVEPFDVYERLCTISPAPYMYYANFKTFCIIGASPELFMNIEDGVITMRPVSKKIQDNTLLDKLEKYEHLLLVDLCRNDIAKVSQVGSLKVNEFSTTEPCSNSSQSMFVSDISGKQDQSTDKYEVLFSTLPPAVLTGAPKSQAILSVQESLRTQLQCGSCIGYIDFRGMVQTALCIRTMIYQNNNYMAFASAGVTGEMPADIALNKIDEILQPMCMAVSGKKGGSK